ncbi:GLPGLI family protein [Aureispira anguillae]|uniref:GLPGLI family protein n=1 Tax=Aureispira anguillae TaxID=2864201 RepID=A0A915YJQ8_9BACT|nr:GLPGLI family protein [Aureispira anguillae]BDS14269.1 GLPGLI family protein [Aureispira anguillae]
MKILFVFLLCALTTIRGFAQKTEGTIHYKETIKLDIDFDNMKGLTEEMKAMIPSEQSTNNVLFFNEEAALYTNVDVNEDKDIDYKSDDEDVQIQIKMDAPEQAYYYDFKNKESIERQDLFGKTFLITGNKKKKWKITTESKEILGYTCKKAISMADEGEAMEAWFTTEIPSSVGPRGINDLPGAVLAFSMKDGQYEVVATQIDFEKVDPKKIVKPKKGKKVNRKEYQKIVEAKQKEMAEIYGGNGNVILKTETIER